MTRVERKLAAILSADAVGYSRLMAADESGTVAAVTRCRETVEAIVPRHGGRLVDFTGDNFLAEFPTATDGIDCAREVLRAMDSLDAGRDMGERLRLRMGLHLGEVRVEGERLFGAGVNVAARLESLAEPGGLCVSAAVRDAAGSRDLAYASLGPQQLKNIPDPVVAFRVDWRPAAAAAAARPCSVAVLPFVNMSPDPEQEFFADGMAAELISALTRVPGLRVIARTSAFSFKGTNADIATIGHRLGVTHVVEGSVRKAGDRLRIGAQLVDVNGGHHLWSEDFDRPIEDVFGIQDEIARTVVEQIGPALLGGSAPLVEKATESPAAYELYLRASDRLWRTHQWETRTAIEMLKDATEIDPRFASGWAQLASGCCQMSLLFDDAPRWHDEACRAVERAFALDPDCADAHEAHARLLWSPRGGFQNHAAIRAMARSLELRPGSTVALVWQGVFLYHVGLFDEARERLNEALEGQPEDPMTLNALAQVEWYEGRVDVACEYVQRGLKNAPGFLFTHLVNSVLWVYLGDLPRAERAITAARELLGDEPLLDANEALLLAKRGDETRALEALDRAARDTRSLSHRHHNNHHSAAAYALIGQPEQAIAQLRIASATGLPNHPLFANDPLLASLHEEPAMQALMAELAESDARLRAEFGDGPR